MSTAHSPAVTSTDSRTSGRIGTALFSVWEKRGAIELARAVARHGGRLLASGGTARSLAEAGLAVTTIEEYAGLPPGLGGRLKTLHPKVHAGILARRSVPGDLEELERAGAVPIDLVCVHLYPFEEAAAKGRPEPERIERIDIGGPALLRAAAKNFEHVAAVCDPGDVPDLVEELDATGGSLSAETRRRLAAKVFQETAAYDAAIAAGLGEAGEPMPPFLALAATKVGDLRYGENPHQAAALYAPGRSSGRGALPGGWRAIGGAELSYNNWVDLAAAAELAYAFDEPVAVIVKHTNPCGVAKGETQRKAWERALASDPVSAFGGIAAFNRPLEPETAEAMRSRFLEAIVAPRLPEEALGPLERKRRLRLVEAPGEIFRRPQRSLRVLPGGAWLLQEGPGRADPAPEWREVSARPPSASERADLEFAWKVVAAVKSNAIVFARNGQVLGVGAGQMSRVDAVRIAVEKARELGHDLRGAALASDAFFPFADGPRIALEAGATAIVQPGGSKRDAETVEAVDAAGAAMIFTGRRLFRH